MKKVVKSLLYPKKQVGFILFNLGMGSLIYVFARHLENTPLAYMAYLLSSYALIIFCIWFYKACKFSNDFIKNKSRVYHYYQEHLKSVTKVSLIFSFFINLVYGLFKLVLGLSFKSEWFITFAAYYLLLCFIKLSLLLNVRKSDFGQNLVKEYKKLRLTGIVLLFLDVILSGMIVLIVHQNQVITYPEYFIYIVAMYDFYLIISALINVVKYRHQKSPILIASKCINLTVAMISMISLEVAMIYEFGSNDGNFKLLMTSWTGFIVCLINSFMAIYMIVQSNKELKNN